ncbi:MAG: histidine protein kinase AsgD [Thermoleophilia bacterium]|nr:histidine protein kinase AsgD [Thermoleophilia bacterium]
MTAEASLESERAQVSLYRRLFEVAAALSAAALPEDIVAVLFAEGLDALGADGGFIGVVSEDGQRISVRRFDDYSGTAAEQLELPITAPYPIAASARDGVIRLVQSNEQLACDFPGMQRVNPADHACATIPLRTDSRIWGAINIAFDVSRTFTQTERTVMELLGVHCSIAFERARRLKAAEDRLASLRALEIHDDVVQDLAVAKIELQTGMIAEAEQSLTRGLEAAKRIVSEITCDDAEHYRRALLD